MVDENGKAIDFSLKDKDGNAYSLKSFKDKNVVLYFYPKDDTPGCTIEALEFTRDLEEYRKLGSVVVGVSGGDEKSKQKFCSKHGLSILLLSDPGFKLSEAYGVYGEKSFMGRKYKGISRTTFVLDKKRNVSKVFRDVKPLGHSREVLDHLRGMDK